MSGTKRKHVDIAPGGPQKNAKTAISENDAPHLPSDVIAHALDFLPFSDVRSAMLTGKHIAVHAAAQMETLNIMEASELNVRVAGRYRNVKEVNIGCILVNRALTTARFPTYAEKEVSSDAVGRIVPFLGCFPKLKKICIWSGNYHSFGEHENVKQFYTIHAPTEGGAHRENNAMMKSLVLSFCGGFDSGLLPRRLDIVGFNNERNTSYTCDRERGSDKSCKVCRAIFKSFPLNITNRLNCPMASMVGAGGYYCVPLEERLQILRRRNDWNEYLSQPCPLVLEMLRNSQYCYKGFKTYFSLSFKEAECLLERRKIIYPYVFAINDQVRDLVKRAFDFGIRPELLSPLDVFARSKAQNGYKFLMAKDTFDWMLSNGFHLDRNIILPLRKDECHVLEALPCL